ncbi:MAG: lysophospholipid acyltransferase family protein [Phycisphaerae bacterium]|nr:lysophospholipid acyltransferase family protein [Phycisphaerae bacterium]
MSDANVIPGAYSSRFAAGFGWYVRRLLRRSFHAVRLARGSGEILSAAADHEGPLILCMSHSSWWDPLVGVLLGRTYFPERSACAPMDREQLRKFAFFRRLGLFGIEPDDPASLSAMKSYVAARFAAEPRPTLYLTPQGRFVDPRAPIELRPGAAAVASATPGCRVLAVAFEYAFWLDQRPEVFIRCEAVPSGESGSTASWQRGMISAMRRNGSALSELVIARDPNAFTILIGGGGRINPFYDAWLRLRGRSVSIDSARVNSPPPSRKAAA